MAWIIAKSLIAATLLITASELAQRLPRVGALLLTLPIASILAFIFTWQRHGDMSTISNLARETLILVPLGLPFFLPLAFAPRMGLSFWPAFAIGVILASVTIGVWFLLGPQPKSG